MSGKVKLFVQARKDGYKVLYPNPTPPEFFKFAGDLRPENTTPYILGKSLYAIALSSDGCIFTKHIIIQDVQRQGLGNVSFSVFIPHSQKLSGGHAVNLLDELVETYCTRYCPDFYLGNIHEDWKIFTDITDKYSLSYNPDFDIETVRTDLNKTAFIYYSNQEELRKYFDSPYQEKYFDFKQVFFVDDNLKDKPENPLNALTYLNADDLTGKIDLENPLYKLEGFSSTGKNGVKIEIWANGSRCSNNSLIRRKDMVRIKYTKNDTYFIPIEVTGFICDNTVAPYLSVHGNKITVKNDVQLWAKKKELRLSITDEQNKPVTDASIVCKDKLIGINKPVKNGIVRFEGEELGKIYRISIDSSGYATKTFDFCPEKGTDNWLVQLKKNKWPVRTGEKIGETGKKNGAHWKPKMQKRVWIPFLCGIIVVLAIIIGFSVKSCSGGKNQSRDKQTEQIKKQIEAGVKNNATNIDSLQNYKTKWEDQKPEIEIKGKFLGVFGTGKPDSTQYKDWKQTHEEIKTAIENCKKKNTDSSPSTDASSYTEDSKNASGSEQGKGSNDRSKDNHKTETNGTSMANELPCSEIQKFKNEFWKLVKSDDEVKTKFDCLFDEKTFIERGYNKNIIRCPEYQNYKTFYNRYLSRIDDKNIDKGNYNYNKGFKKIPSKKRKEVEENLGKLENLTKQELGLNN